MVIIAPSPAPSPRREAQKLAVQMFNRARNEVAAERIVRELFNAAR